jgi:hypothetical protein
MAMTSSTTNPVRRRRRVAGSPSRRVAVEQDADEGDSGGTHAALELIDMSTPF